MGEVFHQRFNLIVNEALLNKVAEYLDKDPKKVTEQDITDVVYAKVLGQE